MPSSRIGTQRERTTVRDVMAAGIFVVLLAHIFRGTPATAGGPGELTVLLPAGLLGVLAADLISGVVHWLCDTFFTEETPVLGRALIQPFREHHVDPLAITRRGFLRVNNSNIVGISVVLALEWCREAGAPERVPSLFAHVWLVSFACAVMLTNQFHKWAHAPQVPRPVAWLHAAHVLVSPVHHARHHDPRDGRAFCVTTGWLNPLMDGLHLFTGLERLVLAVKRAITPMLSG